MFNESLSFFFDAENIEEKKILLNIHSMTDTGKTKVIGNCQINIHDYYKNVEKRNHLSETVTQKVQNCSDKNSFVELLLSLICKKHNEKDVISEKKREKHKSKDFRKIGRAHV